MENATKAIIIAGGILLSIIIISILVILFSNIGDVYVAKGQMLTIEQLEKYNRQFAMYNNTSGLYGSELLSLANLVADYNNRLLEDNEDTTFYDENKIIVKVKLYNYITTEIYDENGKKIKTEYKQRRP